MDMIKCALLQTNRLQAKNISWYIMQEQDKRLVSFAIIYRYYCGYSQRAVFLFWALGGAGGGGSSGEGAYLLI